MNIHKSLILISLLLFGSGVALATPLGISWLEQRQALETALTTSQPAAVTKAVAKTSPSIVQGTPRHIVVPSLGIDASIEDGSYDPTTGKWTLSEESAFYATPTDLANSGSGNTFIYGHNSQKIFGKLIHIQAGAEVTVTTDNGYAFTYIYVGTDAAKPTDVQAALTYSGTTPRLTLQTCAGAWNQTRQLFYFDLKSYAKV